MAETRLLERLTVPDMSVLLWDDYGWSGDIGIDEDASRVAGPSCGRVTRLHWLVRRGPS